MLKVWFVNKKYCTRLFEKIRCEFLARVFYGRRMLSFLIFSEAPLLCRCYIENGLVFEYCLYIVSFMSNNYIGLSIIIWVITSIIPWNIPPRKLLWMWSTPGCLEQNDLYLVDDGFMVQQWLGKNLFFAENLNDYQNHQI